MEALEAYIDSGVLELYVLGTLAESEKLEVERMLEKHPELRNELLEIETAVERYAESHAVTPPEHLRQRILDSIETKKLEIEVETPVIAISRKNTNFFKYAFAASVALLLLSLFAIINLRSQLEESNNQLANLRESNQRFSSRVNFVERELSEANQSLAIFHSPEEYKLVALKGTPKAPTAKMMVAFSSAKEEVMIDLSSIEMPANDQTHQYQLWALVDGKPVDLGVFDTKPDSTGMIKMKSLKNAQAFAVTLEPRGGSISPTMELMMLMGSITL